MMGKRRAALARMERVIERTKAKQGLIEQAVSPAPIASQTVEIAASPPFRPSPYDQARVDKWVSDRLMAGWRDSCWYCRRPFIAGQKFIDVRGNDVVVRFHAQCESEWRRAQEAAARLAMGLDRSKHP
jgi:hypothetical protein